MNLEDVDVGNIALDQFAIGCLRGTTDSQFVNARYRMVWIYGHAIEESMLRAASDKMEELCPLT